MSGLMVDASRIYCAVTKVLDEWMNGCVSFSAHLRKARYRAAAHLLQLILTFPRSFTLV